MNITPSLAPDDSGISSLSQAPPPKVAVVTGAGRGIGRAVAVALLADGWRVAACARNADVVTEWGREFGQEGEADPSGVIAVTLDVTDPDSVEAAFAAVVDQLGRVDLLFNNAGTFGRVAPIDDLSLSEWNEVVAVNLTGTMLCTRAAVAAMKEQTPQGGRIINNGSISAHVPRPGTIAYTATKHAITGLTKSTQLDGRGFNISCAQIDIGNAATDMSVAISRGSTQADGSIRQEPTFDVAEVGRAVAWMASLPLGATPNFVTLTASEMPFTGRG